MPAAPPATPIGMAAALGCASDRGDYRVSDTADRVSDSSEAASVNADGLQLVAPRIRNRGFAAIGQHDRRAVGGMQCK